MRDRGSVTVEAALVISLFIFAVLAFVQMGFVMVVNKHIYTAFSEAVTETAESAFGWQTVLSGDSSAVVYASVYSKLKKKLKEDLLVAEYVCGGTTGILLTAAYMSEDGFVEADVHYNVQLHVPVLHGVKAGFGEKQRQKAYVGYRASKTADTYVYITDYQSVYHGSRSCTHLSLKIHEVSRTVIQDDTKLAACSFCRETGNRYYIAEQGKCYHTSLACPGLTRTIYRVRKASVGNMAPCNRCSVVSK